MSNKHLKDENLSWQSKGLLSYLLSLPDDWKIYANELTKHSKDGRTATNNTIKQLIEHGYILREKNKCEKGKFTGYSYTVNEEPLQVSRCGLPDADNPTTGNRPLLSTDINQVLTEPITNKEYVDNEISTPVKSKAFNDTHLEQANIFAEYILQRDPKFRELQAKNKERTINRYADDIRKLNELDGRDLDEIANVINFSHSDSFWQMNILSAKKLREKYSTLLMHMTAPKKGERKTKQKIFIKTDFHPEGTWVDAD